MPKASRMPANGPSDARGRPRRHAPERTRLAHILDFHIPAPFRPAYYQIRRSLCQQRSQRTRDPRAPGSFRERRGFVTTCPASRAADAQQGGSSEIWLVTELMERSLFGPRFEAARARLERETDPVRLLAMTASVARAIYEDEAEKMGLMRGVSSFSAELRKQEQRFETIRYEMQRQRIEALFSANRQRPGLTEEDARRVLWMYTSRDIYRMLVVDSGWTADRYEEWLAATLVEALSRTD